MKNRVLFIVGPTGVGKTAASLEVAKSIQSEIVSADSRQVYKYMDIGTAKPSLKERAAVPHFFIDIKHPDEYYSAGQFGLDARKCISDIFKRGKQPLVVGGSGLYIRALVDGLFEPKIANETVKMDLKIELREKGISELHKKLKTVDPITAKRLHLKDTQRILRALEVYEITGNTFSEYLTKTPQSADFESFFIGLTMERAKLYAKIDTRVDSMMEAGFLDEVLQLQKKGYGPHLNALKTVGYKEAFMFFDKKINISEMVSLIKQKSRNYAKRQYTWFRKDKRINWIDIDKVKGKRELADIIQQLFLNFEKLA